jgi:hypothetical protein
MKVYSNQDAMDDQKSQLNLVVMMVDQKMIRLMKDGRSMDDLNSLVDLNYRDALPCAYSLISINI